MPVTILGFCVTGVLIATCWASTPTFTYTCFPNGTITGYSPAPALYTHAFAYNADAVCSTVVRDDSTVTITGCSKGDDILLTLSNSTKSHNNIIGGKDGTVFQIRCSDIEAAGTTRVAMLSFTPSFVETCLRPHRTSQSVVHTAVLGTELVWTVEVSDEHIVRPKDCYVVSGQDAYDTTVLSTDLIVDGCSIDINLVQDFTDNVTVTSTYRACTNFFVFKFYEAIFKWPQSDYITIFCSVQLCLAKFPAPCDVDCSSYRRTKRQRTRGSSPVLAEAIATTTVRVLDYSDHDSWRISGASRGSGMTVFLVAAALLSPALPST